MRRHVTTVTLTTTLFVAGFGLADACGQTTLVRTESTPLRASADDTAAVVMTLPKDTAVDYWAGLPDPRQEWREVGTYVGSAPERVKGWVRARDLWESASLVKFWSRDYTGAIDGLAVDSRNADDVVAATWLQFYVGHAQWHAGQLDQAAATFARLAMQSPPSVFRPFAYILEARVQIVRGDLPGALSTYESMLTTLPGYRVNADGCAHAPVMLSRDECTGDPSIAVRATATRALIATRIALTQVIDDPLTTAARRAQAWYDLGQAWEIKEEVDPGRSTETYSVDSTEPRRCYNAAVAGAPGSTAAGDAAWRLIFFSEPYEWEGDVEGEATWALAQYGPFLTNYPEHAHAAEALLSVANATWARGGYPEVFHYAFGADFRQRETNLNQWFDTSGFGGGPGGISPTPDPRQADRARTLFQELLARYPASSSAAMAAYWTAVIDDYCLNQKVRAVGEYQAFIARYPTTAPLQPFKQKAEARVAALRKQPG